MLRFDEGYIENNLKGAIAEKIFELIHRELRVFTFRTGQENLFPNLIDFSNIKRSRHHKYYFNIDVEQEVNSIKKPSELFTEEERKLHKELFIDNAAADKILERFAEENVVRGRFAKTGLASKISSTPDFTVVTSTGNILQFEVKYRYDGELSEEDKAKYLKYHSDAFIFLVMPKEPFIKILIPRIPEKEEKEYAKKFIELGTKEMTKALKELEQGNDGKKGIELGKEAIEIGIRAACDKVEKLPTLKYEELKYEEECLTIPARFKSEQLIYPAGVLNKYKKVLKRFFSEKHRL